MLSKFSVKKPYTVVVGVVLIIILGADHGDGQQHQDRSVYFQ